MFVCGGVVLVRLLFSHFFGVVQELRSQQVDVWPEKPLRVGEVIS